MRYVFMAVVALFLGGCGPKYATQKEYRIGEGKETCVSVCQERKEACVIGCQERFEACQERASERARDRFYEASKQFKQDQAHYQTQWKSYREAQTTYDYLSTQLQNDFRFFTLTCKDKKEAYACARASEIERFQKTLAKEKPLPPLAPKAPSLAQILETEGAGCDRSCGCAEGYEGCFVACGGSVVLHQVCVARCD